MFTLLDTLDAACSVVPAAVRIGLYGLIAGVVAMVLYWRISPQGRIRALKAQMAQARGALRSYRGSELGQIMRLSWRAVRPAAQQLLLVGAPTLVAAAPVALLMAWFESGYSYRLPRAGDLVRVTLHSSPGSEPPEWVPSETAAERMSQDQWMVHWPSEGREARLVDPGSGGVLLRLPLDRPIHTLRRARWWDRFLEGGRGEHLPAEGGLLSVDIGLPRRMIWPGGPAWLCSWHATFMVALSAGAMGTKFRLKIA